MTHDELVQHLSTIADWGYLYSYIIGSRARTKICDAAKGPQGYLWSSDGARSFHYRGDVRCPRGSLSLSGDVALESDGTDTVTINGAISVVSTLIVSGVTTLNGATSNPGTFGLGNEATDFVTTTGSTVLLMP